MFKDLLGLNSGGLRSHRSGQALLVVLASLTLILVVVLPFLLLSGSQLREAKNSAQEDAARQLSDRCVNTVIAQLTDATTGGVHISWASQPGMIRTYDNTGAPVTNYKLFSSDTMRISGLYDPAADQPSSEWNLEQGIYTDLNEPVMVSTGSTQSYAAYPIVDPGAATGANAVEGFSFTAPPGTSTDDPLPMPVKWLYILQDGTMVAPSPTPPIANVDSATVTAATSSNPIVGRIAFWTDDETSKVNINTSSEGTFWDTPRAEGTTERNYGSYQPAANEFQRYPGHPAMTSLSGIFPSLGASSAYPEILYPLIPRLANGGSIEGTTVPGGTLTPNSNRLYASVDEFMFNPLRAQNNAANITSTTLQQAQFFITANARAPEVNLFNQPRISIWPVSSDLAANSSSLYTTAIDRLFAFCSTMRNDLSTPYRYYFQRSPAGADSPTADIGIPRNTQLYQYLHNLTSLAVPGFGGSGILSKYGSDQNQILTEIFDYIRSVNLQDGNLAPAYQYSPNRPTLTDMTFATSQGLPLGQGLVCPTSFNGTHGFGRFPTISKAGIWFIVSQYPDPSSQSNPPANLQQLQAALIFDMFDPSLGYTSPYGGYSLSIVPTVGGNTNPTWGPTGSPQVPFPCTGSIDIAQNPGYSTVEGALMGGRMGFSYLLSKRSTLANGAGYPFISTIQPLTGSPTTLSYTEVDLTVTVMYEGNVIQTINVKLPANTVSMPKLPAARTDAFLGGRFANLQGYTAPLAQWNVIQPEDVVQTVQCASGDARLIAGSQSVAAANYTPHPVYGKQTLAHSLYMSCPAAFIGASADGTNGGTLVAGVSYNTNPSTSNTTPDVPSTTGVFTGGAGNVPGDWDNAFSEAPDGPYINKADEGTYTTYQGEPPYYSLGQGIINTTYFSPNRQLPSPGMFGSLSTGVARGLPWQTLLFRSGPPGHPGLGSASNGALPPYSLSPDYLLLDLFTMPIVQPYAISEPFSSAGKVNMNYQIVPFTYITRETAVRAALKKEMIMAIPNSDGSTYKSSPSTANYRFPINLSDTTGTLYGFAQRFAAHDLFRSASEICSLDLVPGVLSSTSPWIVQSMTGASYGNMWTAGGFWSKHGLTGDNTLERPYTDIYQRLTTRSNTYTVHFRVQILAQPKVRIANSPTEFSESKGDTIAAEYRGSSIVERYIDPNDTNLPDFVNPANATAVVDSYYHYHTLSTKQFNP
jgi:uncharacterized protein (TIGR02600 family)